jgi:hypothetical protein
MIIGNPRSDDAWARIELLLPGIDSAYRPSILLAKRDYPQIFETLVRAYEYTWSQFHDDNGATAIRKGQSPQRCTAFLAGRLASSYF